MHSDQLFLEPSPTGLLRAHGRYYRPYFLIFSMRDHLGFHLRHFTNLLGLGIKHASQDKDYVDSSVRHGLRVCPLQVHD